MRDLGRGLETLYKRVLHYSLHTVLQLSLHVILHWLLILHSCYVIWISHWFYWRFSPVRSGVVFTQCQRGFLQWNQWLRWGRGVSFTVFQNSSMISRGYAYTEPSGTWGVLDSGIWLSLNVPGGWIYLAILYVGFFPPLLPLLFLQYKAERRKGQQKWSSMISMV